MNDPASTLLPPSGASPVPAALDSFLHLSDFFSLGHWAIVAIDKMGGPNLGKEVGEWFAGDWTEVMKASEALINLGNFCEVASIGLRSDLQALEATWEGEAAQAAAAYVGDLADNLARQSASLTAVGEQYEAAAVGVKSAAQAVGSMIESLCDLAIAAGIELAAAAATSWTVVGGVVGGALGAATIVKGAVLVSKIMGYKGLVMMMLDGLMGGVLAGLGPMRGFNAIELPGAYDSPVAGAR